MVWCGTVVPTPHLDNTIELALMVQVRESYLEGGKAGEQVPPLAHLYKG